VGIVVHKKNKEADRIGGEDILSLAPRILELLQGVQQLELENFSMEIGDLDLFIPSQHLMQSLHTPSQHPSLPQKPAELIRESYRSRPARYPGHIREVTLGATKANGGSRARPITIGGATTPAYADVLIHPVNPPVISLDVFDMKISLPRVLREHVAEVMEDPAEWARMNVKKFGADMVTVHLMSTDPLIRDASPREAAKTVEDVLQAVDVPVIVGGCGDPKKDALVFSAVAEMAAGERLLLNSVTLDMAEAKTLGTVAKAARDHGHLLLAFTGLELNNAKELNRRLYEYIPPDQIVMDLTTVALGYGLEYSFTIHERARYAALMGDSELAHPVISAATNAWAAREAWMTMAPEYGPRELRGPVWEALNALTLLLAGIDLFMMMHPASVLTLKDVIHRLSAKEGSGASVPRDWIGARIS
jgi:acetyl-CoA decarbonylase/synthase, CODH/ACS complex subunit delta